MYKRFCKFCIFEFFVSANVKILCTLRFKNAAAERKKLCNATANIFDNMIMFLTVSQSTNTYPRHTLCSLYAKQPYMRLHCIMHWCHYVMNTCCWFTVPDVSQREHWLGAVLQNACKSTTAHFEIKHIHEVCMRWMKRAYASPS